MKRGPQLSNIAWGAAFIVIAVLVALQTTSILSTQSVLGILVPLALIALGLLGLLFGHKTQPSRNPSQKENNNGNSHSGS